MTDKDCPKSGANENAPAPDAKEHAHHWQDAVPGFVCAICSERMTIQDIRNLESTIILLALKNRALEDAARQAEGMSSTYSELYYEKVHEIEEINRTRKELGSELSLVRSERTRAELAALGVHNILSKIQAPLYELLGRELMDELKELGEGQEKRRVEKK